MTETYRVRVSLLDSEPEIWRLVEMSSALALPEVHDVLQHTMGWRNSHLHGFTSADGRHWWDPRSLDEGLTGFDESTATLADVLTPESGPLRYAYDLGDGWEHQIELIEIISEPPRAPVVIRGERRGPLEDSGGAHGYAELLKVLADPAHHDHQAVSAWVRETLGPWHADFDADVLDLERINLLLTTRFGGGPMRQWGDPVTQLADRLGPGDREEFLTYLNTAPVNTPELDETGAEAATVAYRWLLRRIGTDGVKLSAAGWMPPAVVVDAVHDLGWEPRGVGGPLREDTFFPIRHLRESCVRLGLLRKAKGRLLLTATGRRLTGDPLGLWRYLATSWLGRVKPGAGRDGSILFAVELLVGAHLDHEARMDSVRYGLSALGWVTGDGDALTAGAVAGLLHGDNAMVRSLGVVTDERRWSDASLAPSAGDFGRLALGCPQGTEVSTDLSTDLR